MGRVPSTIAALFLSTLCIQIEAKADWGGQEERAGWGWGDFVPRKKNRSPSRKNSENLILSSRPSEGSPIQMFLDTKRFGTAIYSMRWNNMEFINSSDKGRELQTASTFDGYGECYNPTEAGGSKDKGFSSSQVLEAKVEGSVLKTTSKPAYWAFGSHITGACPIGAKVNTKTSEQIFKKTVTMNYLNDPGIVLFETSFDNRNLKIEKGGHYEVLTNYSPAHFNRVLTVNKITGRAIEENNFEELPALGWGKGTFYLRRERSNVNEPMIVSTASGSHAMGIVVPRQNYQGIYRGLAFIKFTKAAVTKWNVRFHDFATDGQKLRNYKVILVVGSLESVKEKMKKVLASEGGL